MTKRGRTLDHELRFYEAVPAVHGFEISQPIALTALSFCRWNEDEYDWGADQYRLLREGALSGSDRDLIEIMNTSFRHHWDNNVTVLPVPALAG